MTLGKTRAKSILIKCVFAIYLLVLIKVIIFKYPIDHLRSIVEEWSPDVFWQGLSHANFTFFKTIRMYIEYWGRINSFENLIGNIVIFIPYGLLLPLVWKKGKSLFSFLLSVLVFILGVELIQMWTNFGAFDVDDILLNLLGALIGYFVYFLAIKRFVKNV
ncbi:MAG: VanZ family protein [Lachnospiraceae bacterium]|nr:VanZ family protein [Lachnospiraceae bacterium]